MRILLKIREKDKTIKTVIGMLFLSISLVSSSESALFAVLSAFLIL